MTISVSGLGKRFNRDWIFRDLTFEFKQGNTYALLGPNGSGKSTLLQVLSGIIPQSEGKLTFLTDTKEIAGEDVFQHLAIAAPYMDLPEEFTLAELIRFHSKFKNWDFPGDIIDLLELTHARNKAVKQFSSGMRQRVKLGLAMFSKARTLFLDEPTTNFDDLAIQWYTRHLAQIHTKKLVFVATNQTYDYPAGSVLVDLANYKKVTKPAALGIQTL